MREGSGDFGSDHEIGGDVNDSPETAVQETDENPDGELSETSELTDPEAVEEGDSELADSIKDTYEQLTKDNIEDETDGKVDKDAPVTDTETPKTPETGADAKEADVQKREGDRREASDIPQNEMPVALKEKIEKKDYNKLSYDEIKAISKETGWSKEVVNDMYSLKEVQHYKDLGLKEYTVNDKKILMSIDINWDQDVNGKTNRERVKAGLVPVSPNNEKIETHHIGQKNNGNYAILLQTQHRGEGTDTVLHDKSKKSEIERNPFTKDRQDLWKAILEEYDSKHKPE